MEQGQQWYLASGLLHDPGPYGFAIRRGASLAGALEESCFHHAATWRLVVRVKILNISNTKSFSDYLWISRACCF